MDNWNIVPGPASRDLAEKIGQRMGAKIINVTCKIFPDGESKITLIDKLRNQPVILVQSTYPPVNTHLFQMFMLAHRLSEEGAEVHAVVPYLAYARQDKEFLKGEIVNMRVLARLFRAMGIKRLTTVDVHSIEGLSNFSIPSYSVSAVPLLAQYVTENFKLIDPIATSPDFGGSGRVEAFSKILEIDHFVLDKSRDRFSGEVSVKAVDLDVKGRDAIIVDDMISTGGSMQRASILLKKLGAKRIVAVCTHPLLISDALGKIKQAGVEELIGTNTVPSPVSKVDVSPSITEHFKTLG